MTSNPMSSPQMVVDVSIEVDGKIATYTIPDSLSITYTKKYCYFY